MPKHVNYRSIISTISFVTDLDTSAMSSTFRLEAAGYALRLTRPPTEMSVRLAVHVRLVRTSKDPTPGQPEKAQNPRLMQVGSAQPRTTNHPQSVE